MSLASEAAADGEPAAPFGQVTAPRVIETWTPLGPTGLTGGTESLSPWTGAPPWSGRVTAIANDPTNPAVAYVGAAGGGAWKTSDSGLTWTPIADRLGSLAIGAIAVDSASPSTLYLATGEANSGSDSYYGSGIYKSTDGGASWAKLNGTAFDRCHTVDLVIEPGDSNTLLAAVSNAGRFLTPCLSGVYRSTDGGDTWTRAITSDCAPTDLAVTPAAPTAVYVAMTKCTTAGIYRSSASGAAGTFAKLGDLVREPVPGPGPPIGRTAVAVAPSDANVVWALATDASSNRLIGAFRSNDGGVSWRRARTPRTFCGAPREPGQCFYDLTVAIDPRDSSKAFAGGIWVYGYGSVKQRPTRLGAGLSGIHSDQHAATIDSLGRLWVGNDGGVYRSDNGGDTFADLNAQLSITQFNSGIAGSLALLVGGTQDNGFVHYEGGRWSAFAAFGDGGASALDPAHPKVIYGTYVNGLVRRSLNGGKDEFPPVFQAPGASEFYAPLLMDPTDPDRVYLGTDRLWRGSRRGRHWERVAGPFDQTMTAVGLTPASDQVAYVAPRGELIVTRDGFDTATNTQPNGLPYRIFSDIAVQSDDAGTAYVTVCGFGSGHVFRTSDFGAHWTDISGNLPDSPANAIAVDETTSPHTLYVGTDVGVYASADAGASWQRAGDMPIVVVTDLLIDKQSDELIAATHGRGVLATQIPRGD